MFNFDDQMGTGVSMVASRSYHGLTPPYEYVLSVPPPPEAAVDNIVFQVGLELDLFDSWSPS